MTQANSNYEGRLNPLPAQVSENRLNRSRAPISFEKIESAGEPISAGRRSGHAPSRASAGRQFSFGGGASSAYAAAKSTSARSSRSLLKRCQFSQTLIDIGALAFGVFLSFVFTLALIGSAFGLLVFVL